MPVTSPRRTSACACTSASPAREDEAALADVRAELQDRYGDPPESVLNLLAAGELRLLCERLGIAQLDRKRTQMDLPGRRQPGRRSRPCSRAARQPPKPAKIFVEMLHIRFAAAAADTSQQDSASLERTACDPAAMMKLVAPQRQARRAVHAAGRSALAADFGEGGGCDRGDANFAGSAQPAIISFVCHSAAPFLSFRSAAEILSWIARGFVLV